MSQTKQSEPSMRILKTETCSTLSGKSKITYRIGCTPDSQIHFSIASNDGGGFFSQEWVAWNEIQKALEKWPKNKPITSLFLYPLFRGKSVNTPSFLLAVLKHLKLLQPIKGKKRSHELLDHKAFQEELKKLVSTKASKTVTKKPATKKKTNRKKTSTRK